MVCNKLYCLIVPEKMGLWHRNASIPLSVCHSVHSPYFTNSGLMVLIHSKEYHRQENYTHNMKCMYNMYNPRFLHIPTLLFKLWHFAWPHITSNYIMVLRIGIKFTVCNETLRDISDWLQWMRFWHDTPRMPSRWYPHLSIIHAQGCRHTTHHPYTIFIYRAFAQTRIRK